MEDVMEGFLYRGLGGFGSFMIFLIIAISIASWIFFAILIQKVANEKGYPSVWWIIAGLFLPIHAIFGLLVLPDKRVQKLLEKLNLK